MHAVTSRRNVLLAVLGAAVVLAAVLVAVIVATSGEDEEESPPVQAGTALPGSEETRALLGGIPQDGTALGQSDAPVTLVEFADLQCPFCAQFAVDVLPDLIDEYVRPGHVRIVYRGLAFIGEDSEKALRAALAAGEQDRLWNVTEVMFQNQGGENSGWVSDGFLRALGPSVPGLDVDAMLAATESDAVDAEIAAAAEAAEAAEVQGTPTFQVGRTGGELRTLELTELAPDPFREAIDPLLPN
jgi:protein-disulfide isomerase